MRVGTDFKSPCAVGGHGETQRAGLQEVTSCQLHRFDFAWDIDSNGGQRLCPSWVLRRYRVTFSVVCLKSRESVNPRVEKTDHEVETAPFERLSAVLPVVRRYTAAHEDL